MRATQFRADPQADSMKTAQFLADLHAANTPPPAASDTDPDPSPDELIDRADRPHWALEPHWALREEHWALRESREFLRLHGFDDDDCAAQ